jgi:GTP pyrophosphokinase
LDSPLDEEKSDCWGVYSVITDLYKPQPERLRDWISNPKTNGYEALHTTVMGPQGKWVEVQIRSKRMHEIAELGLAAHWKYKENSQDNALDEWIENIRETLQNPDTNALDFVTNFRQELFNEEIFVFTPKGQLKRLKAGATALDFAFEIHSELGLKCIGAKINHKLVPLSHKLSNGDQIEILTSSKQLVNEDWLKFVVTSKAISVIRKTLQEEKRKQADLGKETYEKKLKQFDIPLTDYNLAIAVKYYKYQSPYDFYFYIQTKNLTLTDLKELKLQGGKLMLPNSKIEVKESIEETVKKELKKNAELLIMGESSDKIAYKFANCCNPIPGDDVFGFITINEGIKIHRTNCPNAVQLMSKYDYRIVRTKWNKQHEIAFLTGVKINGIDDVGVINKLTNIITGQLKLNMRSISFDTDDGIFEGKIMVYVHNIEQLDRLIEELKSQQGIFSVSRIAENELEK